MSVKPLTLKFEEAGLLPGLVSDIWIKSEDPGHTRKFYEVTLTRPPTAEQSAHLPAMHDDGRPVKYHTKTVSPSFPFQRKAP